MLIKALCDYYDVLAASGKVLPAGYSAVKIHFKVCLTSDGEIDEIIDVRQKETVAYGKGKTKDRLNPTTVMLMQRTEKTGIEANIIEHRPRYIFGLNYEQSSLDPNDETQKAKQSHEEFIKTNLEFIKGLDSPVINAYRAFILRWKPEEQTENALLLSLGKEYPLAGYIFCLSGYPDKLLHEDELVKEKWEKSYAESSDENKVYAQCAITGESEPIARIHNKIRGVSGGLAVGNVLVSFKNPSESSYNNEQSFNSNLSETSMVKYTEALNYLLSSKDHKATMDDITIVYWTMSEREEYDDLMSMLLFSGGPLMDKEDTQNMLSELMKDAKEANILQNRFVSDENLDPNVSFYIAGIKPNSSRLSVKFFCRKRYADIILNIAKHQNDMQLTDTPSPVALWRIKKELISPNSSSDKIDPALFSKLFEAVIYGNNYPEFLLAGMIRRVRTDANDKVNEVRAGVIKACINRRARLSNKKEELILGLDVSNENKAYLCGRLFAVLEKMQEEASGGSLNRTIKDAYFAAVSVKPAVIFPKLIKLSQNHLKKVKYPIPYQKLMQKIIGKMGDSFPETLPLVEQGKFIIGYYQQYQNFFEKKVKDEIHEEDN